MSEYWVLFSSEVTFALTDCGATYALNSDFLDIRGEGPVPPMQRLVSWAEGVAGPAAPTLRCLLAEAADVKVGLVFLSSLTDE
jgi:hypothetical protein